MQFCCVIWSFELSNLCLILFVTPVTKSAKVLITHEIKLLLDSSSRKVNILLFSYSYKHFSFEKVSFSKKNRRFGCYILTVTGVTIFMSNPCNAALYGCETCNLSMYWYVLLHIIRSLTYLMLVKQVTKTFLSFICIWRFFNS